MRYASALALGLATLASARGDDPKLPAMPEAFSSFGAAVADGYVYVYGGHIAKTHTYSTESTTGKFRRLDFANPGRGWEELPPGPSLQGLALVAHGGKLYRIGGMHSKNKPGDKVDSHSVASCSVYDPKSSQWTSLPDLPAARSSHDAAVVGDQIVVLGGWNMKGSAETSVYHDTALVLDLKQTTPAWKSVPQPFKRRALNVGPLGGKVYAVGGMNSESEVEKTVDVFDPKTETWTSGPSLPGPTRNGFAAAVCGSAGSLFANPNDGKVYRLSDARDRWIEVAVLSDRRHVNRIVPLGDSRLLALGGATTAVNLSTVEAVIVTRNQPNTPGVQP
jgi:N-acetylneuraminic acid mutarotase